MLLDAVFNADYEFDIYFVNKIRFGIENRVLNFSKIVFWIFYPRNFSKKCRETYHSMQNFILYKMAYLLLTFVAKDNL
jgi:hypothetical protein